MIELLFKHPEIMSPRTPLWSPRPGDGCVLWLPGQDDPYSATIRDRSGYGNHGTITGATWVRLPSGLWVNSFDGTDDYISVADNASSYVDAGTAYTYLAWVNPTNAASTLVIIGSITAAAVCSAMCTQGGKLRANKYGIGYATISTFTLPVGKWSLCAMTHNTVTTDLHYYGNGVDLDGTLAWVQTFEGRQKCIGSTVFGGSAEQEWIGGIALSRIYNYALSATEIAGIYQSERHLFGV